MVNGNKGMVPFAIVLFSTGRNDPTVYAALGVAAGVYLFYRGFRMLQLKRLIMNTPTSKVRGASLGLVEVSGLAVGPYTITAPLTGYPCYYYHTTVWQRSRGKNKNWQKVDELRLNVPFYLDDNTGRLLVDPRGAQMELHCDFKQQYGSNIMFDDFVPENVRHYLASRGISTESPLRVEEYCIKPKNALYILGTLAENPGVEVREVAVRTNEVPKPPLQPVAARSRTVAPPSEKELRARAQFAAAMGFHGGSNASNPLPVVPETQKARPEVDEAEKHRRELFAASLLGVAPEKLKSDANPLHRQNSPAATGTAAPVGEDEKRRRALFMTSVFGMPAHAAAATTAKEENTGDKLGLPGPEEFDLHPPVVLMKGSHNPAFFISWRSQRDVVSELGWKSALYIWGGPILTLGCVAFLLIHFGAF